MRYHLDGLSQVIASALAVNNMLVNLAGGDVVLSSQADSEISFVIAWKS
jgi:hypothetical protein